MIKNKHLNLMFGGAMILLVASAVVGVVGLPQDAGGPLIIKLDPSNRNAELFGNSGTFFGILGTVVLIVLLNFVLALEVYGREKFLSYAIGATTILITLLFLVAAINITSIN